MRSTYNPLLIATTLILLWQSPVMAQMVSAKKVIPVISMLLLDEEQCDLEPVVTPQTTRTLNQAIATQEELNAL